MKLLWCWRCKMEVPMLDDDEFRQVLNARVLVPGATSEERFALFLREYERITGFHETNPNAVYHHVVSLYGQTCSNCGNPLRTPRAKFCAACGFRPEMRIDSK
jgi:hypothetical protein